MSLAPGTRLGRYEITSALGAGGMGEVYLALDTKLARVVALKVLPAEVASDHQRMRRFTQEARAISALNHPNILTIHEIDQTDSTHFIVTEFIDGVTLRQHMRRTQMKIGFVLDVAIQVASALAAAHAARIVHRDIKPENIMLRTDGVVKVLDFGLAKFTEKKPSNEQMTDPEAPTKEIFTTEPGIVIGTLLYMSPEQARGLGVDARTDIFSLGAVIFEMVTGHVPFEGETPSDVISLVLQREPPPLVSFAPDVPAELQRLVSKALAKDSRERYQSASDLLLDLKNLKQELEFEAKLEHAVASGTRSASSKSVGGVVPSGITTGGQLAPPTVGKHQTREAASEASYATTIAEQTATKTNWRLWSALIVLAAAAIALAGIVLFYPRGNRNISSVAVLPLINKSADAETEYLSDGITESIINNLSQLPSLRVIARNSAFRYKGRETDPQVVGRELGVEAVVTGRIVQRGENLSISVELVEIQGNKQLWGEHYERKVSDLLTVQKEIAESISENLRVQLTGAERQRVTNLYTKNTEAYQLYLRGRYYWNKRTEEAFKKSIDYFNQAIEKDPGYALAYVGLADTYQLLGSYDLLPAAEAYAKAKAAAKRGLEIDEALAEAHTSLAGIAEGYDLDWPTAQREYRRAIELNPNYATAHHWYGMHLITQARFDEARTELGRAQELDPLSLIINANLGLVSYYMKKYDRAIEQYRKTLELDPNFGAAHKYLGLAYERKGMREEAILEMQKALELSGGNTLFMGVLGYTYAVSGKQPEARKLLDRLKEMSKQKPVAYDMAIIHTGLGETDEAFAWLDRAYEQRSYGLLFIKVDPHLDSLRSDTRFADLVRRIGFPQ
jgi:serine/threonine protein kinase/Flp pilus assembly protein TadD